MTLPKDVTDQIQVGDVDGELMAVTRCVCGKEYTHWFFYLSIYPDAPNQCDACGRRFYFTQTIRVFEVCDAD